MFRTSNRRQSSDEHVPNPVTQKFVLAACALICLAAAAPACAAAATGHHRAAAPAPSHPCDGFYAADFAPRRVVTSQAAAAVPPAQKPAKGATASNPLTGTCIVRATAHDDDPPRTFARNDYSRREAFNVDGSRFIVDDMDGFWHLYDANTLQWIRRLDGPAADAEPQWDHADPKFLYYVPNTGGLALYRLNVESNRSETVADFRKALPGWAAKAAHIGTRSEGSPSIDDRYWGFQIENAKYEILGFMVWDLTGKRLVGSRQASIRPDNVTMSPSGRWFISAGNEDGTWAWSPDFATKKKLHHKVEHADLGIAANGHDAYLSVDYESPHGMVFFTDIDACSGVAADAKDAPVCPRTPLFDLYDNGSTAALHFSGKAYEKPGWMLISTYDTTLTRDRRIPWYNEGIFAVELAASPRIYALGPHRSSVGGCYWSEPQATVDLKFTKILFNSAWSPSPACPGSDRSAPRDVDAYMIVLPPNAIPAAK